MGGEVDLMGTLFLKDYLDQENVDAIKRSGIKTGVCARINFETKVREKDVLEAEFISSLSGHTESSKSLGTALSLARVSYIANMTDWFSIAAIPMGARCRDVAVSMDPQVCIIPLNSPGMELVSLPVQMLAGVKLPLPCIWILPDPMKA